MHDLIPLGPALPGALTTAEIDATMGYAEAEKALAIRRAYHRVIGPTSPPGAPPGAPQPCQRMWASPASPTAAARPPPSAAGPAAIGYHHKMAGHEPPTGSEAVKTVLRGTRRSIGPGSDPRVAAIRGAPPARPRPAPSRS